MPFQKTVGSNSPSKLFGVQPHLTYIMVFHIRQQTRLGALVKAV